MSCAEAAASTLVSMCCGGGLGTGTLLRAA